MTDKEFCDLYNSYTGEGGLMSGIDKPKQLSKHCFNGEELKKFADHCISYFTTTSEELEKEKDKFIGKWVPEPVYCNIDEFKSDLESLLAMRKEEKETKFQEIARNVNPYDQGSVKKGHEKFKKICRK